MHSWFSQLFPEIDERYNKHPIFATFVPMFFKRRRIRADAKNHYKFETNSFICNDSSILLQNLRGFGKQPKEIERKVSAGGMETRFLANNSSYLGNDASQSHSYYKH